MATSLKQAFSGGGGIIQLQPDLTGTGAGKVSLTASGSEQTLLNLTGKYAVSVLGLDVGQDLECSLVVIIDGETIFNTTVNPPNATQTQFNIYGAGGFSLTGDAIGAEQQNDKLPFLVENTLVVKITRASGTEPVELSYLVRAIK